MLGTESGVKSISVTIVGANGVPMSRTLNVHGLNSGQMEKVLSIIADATKLAEEINNYNDIHK